MHDDAVRGCRNAGRVTISRHLAHQKRSTSDGFGIRSYVGTTLGLCQLNDLCMSQHHLYPKAGLKPRQPTVDAHSTGNSPAQQGAPVRIHSAVLLAQQLTAESKLARSSQHRARALPQYHHLSRGFPRSAEAANAITQKL